MNDNDAVWRELERTLDDMRRVSADIEATDRQVAETLRVLEHTRPILDRATEEFGRLTSVINPTDLSFFVFALSLHGAATFAFKKLRMTNDKKIADAVKDPLNLPKEHSERLNQEYYCPLEQIWTNPAPFDTNIKAEAYRDLVILKGGNHRFVTLGHDPLLGLIFGTANIMTATLTKSQAGVPLGLETWHIKTVGDRDTISVPASTVEMFRQVLLRLRMEGRDGWLALGAALLKEVVHLTTDLPSSMSLPIPVVPVFSPSLAQKMSIYGLDAGTVAQGAAASALINFVIASLHSLMRPKEVDEALFRARTQKIILYANLLATAGDLAYTLFLATRCDHNALRKFNLGGYLVTLRTICHSTEVLAEIERQFYVQKIAEALKEAQQ